MADDREQAVSKHERAWNILGIMLAAILVGYVLSSAFMIATAAW